jgi:hypothetical protein
LLAQPAKRRFERRPRDQFAPAPTVQVAPERRKMQFEKLYKNTLGTSYLLTPTALVYHARCFSTTIVLIKKERM